MDTCQERRSSAISEHSPVTGTPTHIREWLTSLQPDSPANPSPLPASNWEKMMTAICGPPQLTLFDGFNPDGYSSKTFPVLSPTDTPLPWSTTCVKQVTLSIPRLNCQLVTLEPITSGQEYGLLPTPAAHDSTDRTKFNPIITSNGTIRHRNKQGTQSRASLSQIVKTWPTPTARLGQNRGPQAKRFLDPRRSNDLDDAVAYRQKWASPSASPWRSGKGWTENGHTPQLLEQVGGQLNPSWVEWLMGWPIGWTDLKPLAMDKFRSWWQQHGGS